MNPWAGAKFLIGVVVIFAVLYALWLMLGVFALPHPFPTVIMIIFALIALGFLFQWGGWWGGPPNPPG